MTHKINFKKSIDRPKVNHTFGPLTFIINLMKTGKVKFYNASKGYGFIVDDETKQEVFVHQTALADRIRQDDMVTFEVTDGKKGPNAVNVKKMQ